MSEESSQYNPKFEKQAQGFAIGDNNIIYNYYGYTEEVKVTPVDATDDNLTCPYRGLYHFTPNDSEFFFGRDVFVEKLFQATQTRNFIPVLGASGSGKSSVVLAGLIPKLEEEGHWKFTHFRPGVVRKQNKSSKVDPFYSLAKALVPLYTPSLNKSQQLVEASELAEFLHSGKVLLSDVITDIQTNYSNHRVLLIADQFEEIYTICQDEKLRRHFLDILIDNIYSPAGQSSSPFVFVLTMRADFLGNALSYRPFADILQGADIKLGAMSGEELSQVIEKPAEKLGVTFEEGLVERILNDVEKEPGNLPLLEFALTELWKKRTGKQLTHDAYKSSGQVKGALTKYADKKYSQLTPDEQEQARQIFIQLVRPGEGTEDTRRRANRVELGEENWHLITRKDGLADSRLVVTSRNDSEQETVEVVHESLIQNWDKLREWMETDRKFRVWQEQLRVAMRQWETTNKDKGSLLRGAALVNAEEYLRERPKDLIYEKEFIQQSIKERDHLKRLQLITFGIITAILAGFSFFAGYQWRKSEISQILALRQASEAKLLLNQDLDSLIDILRAAKTLKKSLLLQLFKPETQLQNQVELTLHKAIYQVKEKNIIKIPNEVNEVIFSPNDQLLAILQFDGTVSLLERTGKLSSRFKPFNVGGEVQSITFSADSQKLITVSTDEVVKYWDLNGQQIGKDLKQPGIINEVMLGSNGKVMIFSNNKLRDLESGTLLAEFPQEIGYGTLSPDGKLIAPGWAGDTITIWNVDSQKEIVKIEDFPFFNSNIPVSISFSPDSKLIAAAGYQDDTIYLWNLKGHLLAKFKANQGGVGDISFSPDGKQLATVGVDNTIRIWQDFEGKQLRQMVEYDDSHDGSPTTIALSSDGQTLAVSNRNNKLSLWNLSNSQKTELPQKFASQKFARVSELHFSPDNRSLAVSESKGTIHWLDLESRQTINSFTVEEASDGNYGSFVRNNYGYLLQGISFSQQSEWLAVGGDNNIVIWSSDGQEQAKFPEDVPPEEGYLVPSWVQATSFNPSGNILAAGGIGNVHLWNWKEGKSVLPKPINANTTQTRSVIFSPTGNLIATAGLDGSIPGVRLWNLSGNKLAEFDGHKGWVNQIVFSPDEKLLATASSDNTIRIWDLSGQQLMEFQAGDQVRSIAFTLDSKQLVTVENGPTFLSVKWWEIEDLDELSVRGCEWVSDYLKNNPELKEEDRHLCDGII